WRVIAALFVLSACGESPEATPIAPSPTTPALQPTPIITQPTAPPQPAAPLPTTQAPAPTAMPSSPMAGQSSGDRCGNRYQPLTQGSMWVYQALGTPPMVFTRTVAQVEGNRATVEDSFVVEGMTLRRADTWFCDNGAVTNLALGGIAGVNVLGADMRFNIKRREGVSLPADPQPGTQWSQVIEYDGNMQVVGQNITTANTLQSTCTAKGLERVEVPAGVFEALRVECSAEIRSQISMEGAPPMESPMSVQDTSWYAPGVGLVRSRSFSQSRGENAFANVSSTVEYEIVLTRFEPAR
ncbi:MAG: hypothetical protein NZL91_10290, partial [Thermoflexales bacterium]|nr:hypothetical protein [Thermoflexales bacterium]